MSKFTSEERREIIRKARENVVNCATAGNRSAPELVYKTCAASMAEPAASASAAHGNSEAPWWEWVEGCIAAVAESTGTTIGELLEDERAVTKRELDLLRRELVVLREEVALERSLRTLRNDVKTARAEIPKVPTIEARLTSEHVELRRELAAVKKTLGKVRVDQSLTAYGLSQLERKQARSAAATVVEFETSTSRLVVGNLHPDAAVALKQFAAEVVDARDGGAILFSGPAGTA